MRSRVAFIVTLISLFALTGLYASHCMWLAEDENEDLRARLYNFCVNVSMLTSDYDVDARIDVAKNLTTGSRLAVGIYSQTGELLYGSRDELRNPLAEDVISAISSPGTVAQGWHKGTDNRIELFAIYQYEDGVFLVFEARKASIWTVLFEHRAIALFGIVFAICTATFAVVLRYMRRRERYLDSVMRSLDQFSDGNFDTQIEGFPADLPEVEAYNAVIGRIKDRLFKQRNRNHVLSVVMSQMQNGIIAVDDQLKVIFVTPVAKQFLGIVGNAEGKHINETSKDVRLDELFTEAMHQNGVYTNEVAARTGEGRNHRPLRLYVSCMTQDGKIVGALAIVEDITELRRLEQVRTDFAANVSHELKTPLTSIQGFVETLDAGAIDNPEMAHKFLKIIMMETDRLTRLINDILSISKLESGDNEVAIERIRLDKKAFDVCEMLQINARDREVTLHYRLNDEPVYIMGNPDRVEQLLINLTENAIKYNKPGGSVTVQVFANQKEANVTISDTGIGIAEEHLPRLFERFYRVDKGRSRQMGGTGLGLAIVKHIVKSMGGEIEVQSKLGEGTEFLITIPLAPPAAPNQETIFNDE